MLTLRHSFPEILSLQVSQLVSKIRQESRGNDEGKTTKQLLDKIASLSQPQLARATDALSMIWNGTTGSLDLHAPGPNFKHLVEPTLPMKSRRVELALLKSISTGAFIDVQFHAYNGINNDSPFDLKPLFTSSIVIEEWGSAIATRKSHGSFLLDSL